MTLQNASFGRRAPRSMRRADDAPLGHVEEVTRQPSRRCRGSRGGAITAQPISSNTLKIGMYNAMIIDPTMPPRNAIISGSIRAVNASVVASTSSS